MHQKAVFSPISWFGGSAFHRGADCSDKGSARDWELNEEGGKLCINERGKVT